MLPSGRKVYLTAEAGKARAVEVTSAPKQKAAPPAPKAPPPVPPAPIAGARNFDQDPDAGKAWGHRHYAAFTAQLPREQRDSLDNYTGNVFAAMNGFLRRNRKYITPETRADIKNLDAVLAKAPPIPEPVVVHRGAAHESIFNAQPGEVIRDPAFKSTSLKSQTAHRFIAGATKWVDTPDGDQHQVDHPHKAILEIQIPAGGRGLYITRGDLEHEILMPRSTAFRVLSRHVDASGVAHVRAQAFEPAEGAGRIPNSAAGSPWSRKALAADRAEQRAALAKQRAEEKAAREAERAAKRAAREQAKAEREKQRAERAAIIAAKKAATAARRGKRAA